MATKTVLITGGNRGLGLALVETFAKSTEYDVIATARNPESLPTPLLFENSGGAYKLDLASHDSVIEFTTKLLDDFSSSNNKKKKIDVIIHNAGFNPKDQKHREGYFESTFYTSQFSAANVGESMFINALHPMELTGRLFPILADDAIIIGVSSWLGSIKNKTVPGHYGYTGSKALMNMFIKGMSVEFDKSISSNDDTTKRLNATTKSAEGKSSDDTTTAPIPQRRVAVALNPGWMKTDMGGSNADISTEDVACRVLSMIDDGYIRTCNGKFINTDRTEHEW